MRGRCLKWRSAIFLLFTPAQQKRSDRCANATDTLCEARTWRHRVVVPRRPSRAAHAHHGVDSAAFEFRILTFTSRLTSTYLVRHAASRHVRGGASSYPAPRSNLEGCPTLRESEHPPRRGSPLTSSSPALVFPSSRRRRTSAAPCWACFTRVASPGC